MVFGLCHPILSALSIVNVIMTWFLQCQPKSSRYVAKSVICLSTDFIISNNEHFFCLNAISESGNEFYSSGQMKLNKKDHTNPQTPLPSIYTPILRCNHLKWVRYSALGLRILALTFIFHFWLNIMQTRNTRNILSLRHNFILKHIKKY